MLYRPKDELMWDTWLIASDGMYFLYYIRITPGRQPAGPLPSFGVAWDGISCARSRDLLRWEELGPVLEKSDAAAWLGTGMIHRADDTFVMNFSEERPVGHQVVCFATSQDLVHWKRLPEEYDLRPDPSYYQTDPAETADPLPRWDSIGVVPPSGERSDYLGFITANARDTLPGQCGTLGLLRSPDGLRWQQLPPAVEPGFFPSYEVPAYVRFGPRHYVLFSSNSLLGPRFDPLARGPHSGIYYVVADNEVGPYVRPPADSLLLGQRDTTNLFGTYVGRTIDLEGEGDRKLFYHHWTARFPDAWWGPPKLLVERRPYELGLAYWPGVERLKDRALAEGIPPDALEPLQATGNVPVIDWSVESGSVRTVNQGGAHGVAWHVPPGQPSESFTHLTDGRVFEADIRIIRGRGLGVWMGHIDDESSTVVVLNAETENLEIGSVSFQPNGASLVFEPRQYHRWPIARGVHHALRILARRSFLEVYLDDQLVHAYVTPHQLDPNRLGFYAELATGDFLRPRLWSMG